MSAAANLTEILHRADVWRGDRLAVFDGQTQSSGFDELDAQLPGGGWPRGALVELLADQCGIGEISLLLPALRVVAEEAPIAVVAPPHMPHAPAWAAQFALAQLLCVQAPQQQIVWSAGQLLACGAIGAMLAWLPAHTSNSALRRLQLACEGSRTLVFLLRPSACVAHPSPAPLRLALEGCAAGMRVHLLKRRGPACIEPLVLRVERPLSWSRLTPEPPIAARPAPERIMPRHGEIVGVPR